MSSSTCIEVALNGPWMRHVQPGIPITVDEIVQQGIECVEEGAAIVHFHAYDEATGKQTTDLAVVLDIMDRIKSKVDAIIYPAIRYISNAEAISPDAGPLKYEHLRTLAERERLEWLIVDPGSTNLITFEDGRESKPGFVDINSPASIRHGLELAARHRLHPTFAIYEPGYLRLADLLSRAVPSVPTPMFRFMFSADLTFGFPPEPFALDAYVRLLGKLLPDPVWMVAGLGVDVSHLFDATIEAGGHLRVGLEDAPLGCTTTNRELVRKAARTVRDNGNNVMLAAELRKQMRGTD